MIHDSYPGIKTKPHIKGGLRKINNIHNQTLINLKQTLTFWLTTAVFLFTPLVLASVYNLMSLLADEYFTFIASNDRVLCLGTYEDNLQ